MDHPPRIGSFLDFFSACDTLAGIGMGLAMRTTRDLSAAQQEGVFTVVKDWPGVGPVFALSILGTLGWVVAVGALALAARRLGASRPEWITLALAAVFLMGGHPSREGRSPSVPSSLLCSFTKGAPLQLVESAVKTVARARVTL